MASIKVEKQLGATKRAVIKGLVAYNTLKAGNMGDVPVSISLREKGKIVGGIVGEIFFGWMFVSLFWIDDKHRGKGFGRRLLAAAEAQARNKAVRDQLKHLLATREIAKRGTVERVAGSPRHAGQLIVY